jgi:branched-subunit amino acid ABC-type transport system permease component
VERLCFAPHRGGSAIAAMVASFALWMQFEELATLVMPRHLYAFPLLVEDDPLALGLLEAHSQWYLGPQLRDLIAYLLLFVLLAARVPWMHTRSAS